MISCSILAQHILTLHPEKDVARLSFYNFLKNLCDANEAFTPEVLNRFYYRALTFTHWQTNKRILFEQSQATLAHFLETQGLSFQWENVVHPDQIQPIAIESPIQMELILSDFYKREMTSGERFQLFQERGGRVVGIALFKDGRLSTSYYNSVAFLVGGRLIPAGTDLGIHYTRDLGFSNQHVQLIDVSPHTIARFVLKPDGIFGVLVRGYTFQKVRTFDGGGLHLYPELFYPVKRLEQFFINRRTDALYVELIKIMEKGLELLAENHSEGEAFAQAALERGQLAFEQIYPDDRPMILKIHALESALKNRTRNQEEIAPKALEPQVTLRKPFTDDLIHSYEFAEEQDSAKENVRQTAREGAETMGARVI